MSITSQSRPSFKIMDAMVGPLAHWLRMVSSAFSDIRNTLKDPVPPKVLASFCANFSHVLVINSGLMLFP